MLDILLPFHSAAPKSMKSMDTVSCWLGMISIWSTLAKTVLYLGHTPNSIQPERLLSTFGRAASPTFLDEFASCAALHSFPFCIFWTINIFSFPRTAQIVMKIFLIFFFFCIVPIPLRALLLLLFVSVKSSQALMLQLPFLALCSPHINWHKLRA